MSFGRNWNVHKQLHPWIKQLMTQPWAEHMVLWAWDRQTRWQQMGQWFQTKLLISSANLDLPHEPLPLSLILTTHVQLQCKKTAKKFFAGWSFSAEETWSTLTHELDRTRPSDPWQWCPGVGCVSWSDCGQLRAAKTRADRLVSISKSLRHKSFPLYLNAC